MPDFERLEDEQRGEIPLNNDWTIRRKDIKGISSVTGELEDTVGLTGIGWLSDTEGGPPIHGDLQVPLAAVAGKNIILGTIQGDALAAHLTGRVGQRVWEVVTAGLNDGDYTDSVPLWVVPIATPRGAPCRG